MSRNERFIHRRLCAVRIAETLLSAMMLITGTTWAQTYAVSDLATLAQGSTAVVRGPNGQATRSA